MNESTGVDAALGPDFDWAALEKTEIVRVPPPANGPILMIVVGLVVLAASAGDLGLAGVPVGLVIIAVAIGWWVWKKPSWQLRLTTGSRESVPFESVSREEVEGLASAIAERRGSGEG